MALPDDFIPVHVGRDKLEDIAHQYSRSPKGELTVADRRVGAKISSNRFRFHPEFILKRLHPIVTAIIRVEPADASDG
jgi:RecB family exonuclease